MISFQQSIADAYVIPTRSVSMPTTPGRTVRFMMGHAVIKDGRDLVALMRRPDVKLVMTPYSMSWVEEWLAQAGDKVRAEILIPDDQPAQPAWDAEAGRKLVGAADGAGADTGTV